MSERPTDLELMAYGDGELDDVRRAEVEAYLLTSPAARAKIASLELVGELLREHERDAVAPSEDLVDAIMRRVKAAPEDVSHGSPALVAAPRSRRAANDNTVRIFAVAAAAVAMAAGLAIWARVDGPPLPSAFGVPSGRAVVSAALLSDSSHVAVSVETEAEVGASVAAVDFGSNTGSIFYVPNAATVTTVVWVAENVSGEP